MRNLQIPIFSQTFYMICIWYVKSTILIRYCQSLGSSTIRNLDGMLQVEQFEQLHNTNQGKEIFHMKEINVGELSQKYGSDLREFLLSHIGELMEIKRTSQFLQQNYTYDPLLKPFYQFNDKDPNPDRLEIRYSTEFNVNTNNSFVQVPTEIFRNHTTILNEINWSRGLDEVFKQNYQRNPTLQWQYIGKETGVMRSYPGVK